MAPPLRPLLEAGSAGVSAGGGGKGVAGASGCGDGDSVYSGEQASRGAISVISLLVPHSTYNGVGGTWASRRGKGGERVISHRASATLPV